MRCSVGYYIVKQLTFIGLTALVHAGGWNGLHVVCCITYKRARSLLTQSRPTTYCLCLACDPFALWLWLLLLFCCPARPCLPVLASCLLGLYGLIEGFLSPLLLCQCLLLVCCVSGLRGPLVVRPRVSSSAPRLAPAHDITPHLDFITRWQCGHSFVSPQLRCGGHLGEWGATAGMFLVSLWQGANIINTWGSDGMGRAQTENLLPQQGYHLKA
mmetsp:Transcript_3782/g.9451  ORF Transcript_3782/g.9451 Transcript_3782/m.9451 type:complete len:214 (+) Transcript_3782:2929-3570(+)